jgi:flagellar motility protein MotE (MotC chaperone)
MIKLATNPVAVLAIAVLLGVSTGLAWFWNGAGPLIVAAKAARAKAVEAAKPDAPWGFWTIEIENLASELRDQKAVLKKREDELVGREERLNAERQELLKQRQQLEALRTEIGTRLITIQADEVKNLKSLVATYSNLSPKATLTIFKEMDDNTVVKLLALMKTDIVSPLFEEMSKQAAADPATAKRAAVLSEKLRLFKAAQTAPPP